MAPASSSSTAEICHALAPILFASSFLHMQSRFFAADIADIYAGKIDETLSSAYTEWQQTLNQNLTVRGHYGTGVIGVILPSRSVNYGAMMISPQAIKDCH